MTGSSVIRSASTNSFHNFHMFLFFLLLLLLHVGKNIFFSIWRRNIIVIMIMCCLLFILAGGNVSGGDSAVRQRCDLLHPSPAHPLLHPPPRRSFIGFAHSRSSLQCGSRAVSEQFQSGCRAIYRLNSSKNSSEAP